MVAPPAGPRPSFKRCVPAAAFSLVEVVLALGILTFAVLMLLALVPAGLQTNRDTNEEGAAANIARAIVSDWQATGLTTNASPLYGLPSLVAAVTQADTLGIADNGSRTALAAARYRVAYRVTPPPSGSFLPYCLDITVSWPAQSTNAPAHYESVAALSSR